MEIKFQTDIGQRRKMNQDNVGVFANRAGTELAVVADGMGGHLAGDVASDMTITLLGENWQETELGMNTETDELYQWLTRQIQQANQSVYEKGQGDPSLFGMGTTVVALILLEKSCILAHVGDSRCYLVRSGKLQQLTEDHSLVNALVKQGEITPEMANHHPKKNFLTRTVGMPGTIEVDVSSLVAIEDDYLLLCSDGLTNMLSDERILEIIQGEARLD